MAVSQEQLEAVDVQLAELGKSEDEVQAILDRFREQEPLDLTEVDAGLESLGSALGDMERVLRESRSPVGSVFEPSNPSGEHRPFAETEGQAEAEATPEQEDGERGKVSTEAGPAEQEEPADEPLVLMDLDSDLQVGGAAFPQSQPPDSEIIEDPDGLFDIPGEAEGDDTDLSVGGLFDDSEPDTRPVDLEAHESEPPRFSDVEMLALDVPADDAPSVFTEEELEAIRSQAPGVSVSDLPHATESFADQLGDPSVPAGDAGGPSPEDPDLPEEATRVDSLDEEFELLVGEDVLVADDTAAMPLSDPYTAEAAAFEDAEAGLMDMDTSEVPREEFEAIVAASSGKSLEGEAAEEQELDENGEPKKGFFKKLFGK